MSSSPRRAKSTRLYDRGETETFTRSPRSAAATSADGVPATENVTMPPCTRPTSCTVTPGAITADGLRSDISVGFQYISFWLGGRGAAAIDNLMEDAATAEISRSQLWQWIRHGASVEGGPTITRDLVREILEDEMARIHADVGDEVWAAGRPDDTREVFERVALGEDFPEFLTLVAYDKID